MRGRHKKEEQDFVSFRLFVNLIASVAGISDWSNSFEQTQEKGETDLRQKKTKDGKRLAN